MSGPLLAFVFFPALNSVLIDTFAVQDETPSDSTKPLRKKPWEDRGETGEEALSSQPSAQAHTRSED